MKIFKHNLYVNNQNNIFIQESLQCHAVQHIPQDLQDQGQRSQLLIKFKLVIYSLK